MTFTIYDRATVGVYSNHTDAEAAVRMLEKANISLKDISIIGHDKQAREAALGSYSPPEFVKQELEHQGEQAGILMGGLWGLLVGCGSFFLPGVGLLVVLGPLAGLVGGMAAGAIGGDLAGQMTFTDIAAEYRGWLVAGKYLVIVHCTTAEEPHVLQVLESTQSGMVKSHPMVFPAVPLAS
jgi:uncharacterized membrane protein